MKPSDTKSILQNSDKDYFSKKTMPPLPESKIEYKSLFVNCSVKKRKRNPIKDLQKNIPAYAFGDFIRKINRLVGRYNRRSKFSEINTLEFHDIIHDNCNTYRCTPEQFIDSCITKLSSNKQWKGLKNL